MALNLSVLSLLCTLLTWAFLPPLVLAGAAAGDDTWYGACVLALAPVRFQDLGQPVPKLNQTCQSYQRISSLYLCLKAHSPLPLPSEGLVRQNETCREYNSHALPPFGLVDAFSGDDVARMRHLEPVDEKAREAGIPINETVLVSDLLFRNAYDTLNANAYVSRNHRRYGAAVIFFWIVVVTAGLGSRTFSAFVSSQHSNRHSKTALGRTFGRLRLLLKRHVTIPATFGYRCAQNLGWCTIPPRVQSLTITAFILLNVFFCMHGYRITDGNIYFPGTSKQVWRYLSDRTGIISFANFPIIWVFGMRNNLLLWMTGWEFATYNNFHRWVARVSTLQAVIHSVGYTVLVFQDGGWQYYYYWWGQMFWWAGELASALVSISPGKTDISQATVGMCLILGFSVFWMRRRHYETFLVLHILLSILVLATMIGHVSIFKIPYDMLGWIPAFLWLGDRVIRYSRILAFNIRFWDTKAVATYNSSSNIVRIVIPHATSFYNPRPGTFYYLHVLNDTNLWESHPFTMAYSTTHHRQHSRTPSEDTPLMLAEEPTLDPETKETDPSMTFLIRPYDSFTARLRDAALRGWPSPASLRVLVDGPYGHAQPFENFGNVLFILGGSGIVVALTYLQSLISSPHTRSIQIVWAVREQALAEEVLTDDIASLVRSDKLSIKVFVTRQDDFGNVDNGLPKDVDVRYGRPNADEEVQVATASLSANQSLAVVACGPARMSDDTRRAVAKCPKSGGGTVDYFEESFTW